MEASAWRAAAIPKWLFMTSVIARPGNSRENIDTISLFSGSKYSETRTSCRAPSKSWKKWINKQTMNAWWKQKKWNSLPARKTSKTERQKYNLGPFTPRQTKHQKCSIYTTAEEFKNNHQSFVFVMNSGGQGDHMIIVMSRFSRSSVFKMFSTYTERVFWKSSIFVTD